MQSPQNKITELIDKNIIKIIVIGLLVILFVAVIFFVTKGSDISFCFFSLNCNKSVVVNPLDTVGFGDLLAAGAGATTASLLVAVINAPVTVAVGVGIAIWWIVNALLS
jgi:hypothetical protein